MTWVVKGYSRPLWKVTHYTSSTKCYVCTTSKPVLKAFIFIAFYCLSHFTLTILIFFFEASLFGAEKREGVLHKFHAYFHFVRCYFYAYLEHSCTFFSAKSLLFRGKKP